tara:strand:+ start:75 stop:1013 length:939 start_codon:yes stop_codon:yes gene_type:complete
MEHVFITGCPRSGTTMLASMLGNAKTCVTTPESDFFIDFIYKHLSKESASVDKRDLVYFFNNNYRFKQWGIDANEINNLPEKITYTNFNLVIENTMKLFSENHSGITEKEFTRIDHTPSSIKHFDILNDLFPESKFIFVIRDPRAVYASVKGLDWGANTSLRLNEIWIEYAAIYFSLQKIYPNRICLIKYEDVLTNAPLQLNMLCDFIGIDYSDSLLDGKGFKIPGYTASQHTLVGKNLDKSRIEKWKKELKKDDILIIESQCKTIMRAFDYQSFQAIKYRIRAKDRLKMLFDEIQHYLTNKVRKKTRENKA